MDLPAASEIEGVSTGAGCIGMFRAERLQAAGTGPQTAK